MDNQDEIDELKLKTLTLFFNTMKEMSKGIDNGLEILNDPGVTAEEKFYLLIVSMKHCGIKIGSLLDDPTESKYLTDADLRRQYPNSFLYTQIFVIEYINGRFPVHVSLN